MNTFIVLLLLVFGNNIVLSQHEIEVAYHVRYTEAVTTTTEPTTTIIIPTECPIDDSGLAVHIAHECNCTLFYKCSHGEKFLQECPDKLYFNPILQVCDYRRNVNCTTTCVTTQLPSTTQSSSNTLTSRKTTKMTAPSKMPIYTINWLKKQSKTSNEGNNLDQNNVNVKCKESKTTKRSHKSTRKPQNSATPNETTKRTTKMLRNWDESETCIGTCPTTDNEYKIVFLPNEDCSKFCICEGGRAFILSCPPTMHFNDRKNVCDFPEEAKCAGQIKKKRWPNKWDVFKSFMKYFLRQ